MSKMPTGWDTTAHNSWLAGQRQVAIQQLLARLNGSAAKPVALQLQFAYYLFLCDDRGFRGAGAGDGPQGRIRQ
nr:hypothetical protein [Aeromonas sp. Y318-1]